MQTHPNPAVLVIQEQVPPYRVPFFRYLADELARRQLQLCVVSSTCLPRPAELGFHHRHVPPSRTGLSALPLIRRERPQALVLPHSGHFAPLAVAASSLRIRGQKQLFWGMGLARRYGVGPVSDQSAADAHLYGYVSARDRRLAGEAVRRLMLRTCDHYLSYTQASTSNLIDNGFDSAKVTTLNNAVERLALRSEVSDARRKPLHALFVASLVDDKEPLTAVAIIDRLRDICPGASLHIAGDGPLRSQCEAAARQYDWVHYHGPKRGNELKDVALTSDLALLPGRVGLAIVEMASVGLPLATLATSLHGAEISYMRDGVNGLFLSPDLDKAAKQLDSLLTDRPALDRMRTQALAIADQHTVHDMAANYANGVLASFS